MIATTWPPSDSISLAPCSVRFFHANVFAFDTRERDDTGRLFRQLLAGVQRMMWRELNAKVSVRLSAMLLRLNTEHCTRCEQMQKAQSMSEFFRLPLARVVDSNLITNGDIHFAGCDD